LTVNVPGMSLVIAALGVAPNASRVLASLAGTPAGDQLPAVFQPPLTVPVQVLVGAWAAAGEAPSTERAKASHAAGRGQIGWRPIDHLRGGNEAGPTDRAGVGPK